MAKAEREAYKVTVVDTANPARPRCWVDEASERNQCEAEDRPAEFARFSLGSM
ncbi:MAG: hypothetical protein K0Q73_8607 [Paenibacillus sp.]|nr:hypothetical protein [Paenibacillus sp.]